MKIYLIGFMGSGKSLMGKKLASEIDLIWYDFDKILEERFERTIGQIFTTEGEDWFRDREAELLLEWSRGGVISTGGGIIEREDNREILKRDDSLVIWLNLPWEELYPRIKNSERPLVRFHKEEEIRELFIARRKWYREVADIVWQSNDINPDIINQIKKR